MILLPVVVLLVLLCLSLSLCIGKYSRRCFPGTKVGKRRIPLRKHVANNRRLWLSAVHVTKHKAQQMPLMITGWQIRSGFQRSVFRQFFLHVLLDKMPIANLALHLRVRGLGNMCQWQVASRRLCRFLQAVIRISCWCSCWKKRKWCENKVVLWIVPPFSSNLCQSEFNRFAAQSCDCCPPYTFANSC